MKAMKEMRVRLTFTEEVLGTTASDKKVYATYIGDAVPSKEALEEELDAIPEEEKVDGPTLTIFPRNKEDKPILWDYQIKGFFKNAAGAINSYDKLTSHKKKIDNLVFIKERQIELQLPEGGEISMCSRPLRGQTAQGERIAIATSETVPAGTFVEFTIMCLVDDLMTRVIDWLDYGQFNGIGQWHNSGKGRFTWEDISEETEEVAVKKRGRKKKEEQ